MRGDKGDLLRAAALAERLHWGTPMRLLEVGDTAEERRGGEADAGGGAPDAVQAPEPGVHRPAD